MNYSINNIITELKNIKGATNIPVNEVQNFNPPTIKFPSHRNLSNVKANRIWSGGHTMEDQNINEDQISKTLENIKPIVGNKERLGSILSECKDFDDHIWGSPYKNGTEAIAWYKSFHHSKYWGIYISYSSFLNFASKYSNELTNPEVAIDLAWGAIMSHESIHYGFDVACAKLELIVSSPIYINSKNIINQNHGYSHDEEMIAEGVLLRYLISKRKLINDNSTFGYDFFMKFILDSLENLPPGYRDARNAMSMKSYKYHADDYIRKLITISGGSPQILGVISDLSNLMPLTNERSRFTPGFIDWSQCPIYIVDDSPVSGFPNNILYFIHSISGIVESLKFQKLIYPRYINQWKKTLTLLSNPAYPKNSPNLDFKRWPDEDNYLENIEAWSVRVGGKASNLRAHIDHTLGSSDWIADRFGNSDKMGHHKNKK